MQILLIYNPNAGEGVQPQLRELVDLIHAAGHEVLCRSSKDPRFVSALADPADLVAVAGGDGTVVKVVRRLRGKKTAIALLPLGTANNISAALGLKAPDLETQIQEWSQGRTVAMDVGVARGPRGARTFLESVGAGLMPRLMSDHHDSDGSAADRLARAVERARRIARRAAAVDVHADLDGQDVSGRYVLFEAMNIGWVGPNLNLVDADPADGVFDLVRVHESERSMLVDWLAGQAQGAADANPFPRLRGRTLRIEQADFGIHVDDEIWTPERTRKPAQATVEVSLRDTVCFRVPRRQATATPWMRRTCQRERDLREDQLKRRFELTPSRWAWPAARRARSHR